MKISFSLPGIVPTIVSVLALSVSIGYVVFLAPHEVLRTVARMDVRGLVGVCGAVAVSVGLGGLRLAILLRHSGYQIDLRDAVWVVAASQLAATLFVQIVAQIGSRSVLLARLGVPVEATVLATILERGLGLLLLLVFALVAAFVLFGGARIDLASGGAILLSMIGAVGLAASMATIASWPHIRGVLGPIGGLRKALVPFSLTVAVTIGIHLSTLTCFVFAVRAFAPEQHLFEIAAASTIVMLATAVPISFGGWGIRELSSIAALGAVGVEPHAALMASVTTGLVVLIVVATMTLIPSPQLQSSHHENDTTEPTFNAERILGVVLVSLSALLVFFQVHVPVNQAKLNLNLGDPIAILAGTTLAATFVLKSRPRVDVLWLALLAPIVALVAGYAHSYLTIGPNPWAATKAWGFLVLLGWAAVGSLAVSLVGSRGRDIIVRIMLASFLTIAFAELLLQIAFSAGLPQWGPRQRAEGWSRDANAYAFQGIVVLAMAVTIVLRRITAVSIGGVVFATLWFSASRSGMVGLTGGALVAALIHRETFLRLVFSALLGMALVLAIGVLGMLVATFAEAVLGTPSIVDSSFGMPQLLEARPSANSERFSTWFRALEMFREAPVFGHGLGAFIGQVTRSDGSFVVIHSTYLWLLAEMGIVGFAAFAIPVVVAFKRLFATAHEQAWHRLAALILPAWLIMAHFQDMAYQRIGWLALGIAFAFVAKPAPDGCARARSGRLGPT